MGFREQIDDFIHRGKEIERQAKLKSETKSLNGYVDFSGGFGGHDFNQWINEIEIFNQKYLKDHPLHVSIHSTYFYRQKSLSAFKNMMGYLYALKSDKDIYP